MNLEELRAALQKALAKLNAHMTAERKDADGNKRAMTDEEREAGKVLVKAVEDLKADIKLAEEAGNLAVEQSQQSVDKNVTLPAAVKEKPFKSLGEQLISIARATMSGDIMGQSDPRLKGMWQRAAGANETIPSEGGFLVQEDFSTQLLTLMHEDPGILGRLTWLTISNNSNQIKLPTIDETSRARGSRWGGVRAYWLAEGEQKVDSKPKFGEIQLGLNKIAALGYVTDELLQDNSVIQTIMEKAFREEIMFEVTDAVFNGNGSGKPLGILNSGAVITVPKETSQANNSIVFANLVKMMNHLPTRSRRNAVWVVGDSGTETALYSVTLPGGNGYPIFLPPGQNTATPGNALFGTLLGRPIIPVEHLPGLGAAGDLMLIDFSEYLAADRGGIQEAQSIHVRFVYDETCFRMVYRVDGKPAWRQPVTTANGALEKSPFVALGARQ